MMIRKYSDTGGSLEDRPFRAHFHSNAYSRPYEAVQLQNAEFRIPCVDGSPDPSCPGVKPGPIEAGYFEAAAIIQFSFLRK